MSISRTAILRTLKIILSVGVITAISACSMIGDGKIKDSSLELADRISKPLPAQSPETSSGEQRVYIDSSLSIKGFISGIPASRTRFEDFIDTMPDMMPGCKVFRYGQSQGQEESKNLKLSDIVTAAEFDGRLHDPAFYQMEFNPDDVLIKALVTEQRPVMSIILTDGVESASAGQINTVIVDAIRDWIKQGKLFAILMFKSRFAGQLYSEHLRSMIDNVQVDNRPFYAFVFSPSRREFDDLHEKMTRRFTSEMRTIVLADDAMSCLTELPTTIEANYANNQPPEKPYHWQMLTMKKVRPDAEEPLAYKFSYEIKPTYPIKSLGMRLTSKLYRWEAKQFQAEGNDVPSAAIDLSASDFGQTFVLKPVRLFEMDSQADYSFYSIEPSVYIKEISPEIAALSTRDDSTASAAGRTYRFQELVSALLDVHLKERILPRITPQVYVTVSRK